MTQTTAGVRPARLSSRRAKVAWPLAAVLTVLAVVRFAAAAHDDGGALALVIGLVGAAVVLGLVALLAEWRYHVARDAAVATGLPFVMPTVVKHSDLAQVGGWAGGIRTGQPLAGYLATDGSTLRWFPVRWTRIPRWARPFTVDLSTVTKTEATKLSYGVRTVAAVVLHLTADGHRTELTVGCTNWQKAGVEHSPLAKYVAFGD